MPFELSNASASFQNYINKILAKKLNIFVIIYLDDIFIYTKNPSQGHVNAVSLVLKELEKHSLLLISKSANFTKTKFAF